MTISVKDAASWKTAIPYGKDASTWKPVQVGYVKDAGTWKQFWVATLAALPSSIGAFKFSTSPTDSFAGIRLHSDGTIDVTEATSLSWNVDEGTWLVNGAASEYECLATLTGGSVDSGTFGSWMNLSTTRAWSSSVTGIDAKAGTFTLQIRLAATGEVLATASCSINAEVEA